MSDAEWARVLAWPGLAGEALGLALPFAAGVDGERAVLALVTWAEHGGEPVAPAVLDLASAALEEAAGWLDRREPGRDAQRQMRLWLEAVA